MRLYGLVSKMAINLDHAATTPLKEEVLNAMLPYLKENYGNPSSLYAIGIRNRKVINEARKGLMDYFQAESPSFYFTSGGSEANNWALKGLAFKHPQKREIITTRIEHHSILNTCSFLERLGFTIHYLSVDQEGFIDLKELEEKINERTLLVSIHYGNNEIGTIQNVEVIGQLCRKQNVYFHTDATQAVPQLTIDLKKLPIDLMTFSAHKFGGPKGIGCLYIREGIEIEPLIHGGDQEKKHRGGTENIAGIVGLVTAIDRLKFEKQDKKEELTLLLYTELKKAFEDRVRLNGPLIGKNRLIGNLNLSFRDVDGSLLAFLLDQQGIYVSTGSACDSERIEPSHVLQAIQVPKDYIHGSLRFTLGKVTTREEILFVVEIIKRIIKENF